ncbi:MAG: hypothetical protein GY795_47265 [Desulfobacterales bacterium]|nr:hypothetical protein [Desulfobacterales bacterium]
MCNFLHQSESQITTDFTDSADIPLSARFPAICGHLLSRTAQTGETAGADQTQAVCGICEICCNLRFRLM